MYCSAPVASQLALNWKQQYRLAGHDTSLSPTKYLHCTASRGPSAAGGVFYSNFFSVNIHARSTKQGQNFLRLFCG
jgi:hypothetical protein